MYTRAGCWHSQPVVFGDLLPLLLAADCFAMQGLDRGSTCKTSFCDSTKAVQQARGFKGQCKARSIISIMLSAISVPLADLCFSLALKPAFLPDLCGYMKARTIEHATAYKCLNVFDNSTSEHLIFLAVCRWPSHFAGARCWQTYSAWAAAVFCIEIARGRTRSRSAGCLTPQTSRIDVGAAVRAGRFRLRVFDKGLSRQALTEGLSEAHCTQVRWCIVRKTGAYRLQVATSILIAR